MDDYEVKRALYEWLHNQPKNFFPDIKKLVHCVMRRKEIILKSNVLLMSDT